MPVTEAQKRATAKYEKENYDKVLVRFPKGTKERIQKAGAESVNGYIIKCVLDTLEGTQKADAETKTEEPEKVTKEPTNAQNKPNKTLEDLQAIIDARKAEQDRKAAESQKAKEEKAEQEKQEKQAFYSAMVEGLRNGEPMPEDAEKEAARRESIAKNQCPF